jgi:hypothetical protein
MRRNLLVALAVLVAAGMLSGAALADTYDSPASVTATGGNTVNWTGQGTTSGSLDTVQCDANNDGYLLWIFTTDHATLGSPDPVLTVDGTTYSGSQFGNEWHFVTPYSDPGSSTASVAFAVTALGSGGSSQMNLVISHGCSGTGTNPPAAAPTIDKTASQNANTEYSWTINKAVDHSELDLTPPTSSATFNYTVTVTHDGGTVSYSDVTGDIKVTNPNNADITLESISDQLSDGTNCTVDESGDSSLVIPATGDVSFPYSCGLSAPPTDAPNTTNTATMSWSTQTLSDNSFLAGDTAHVTVPVTFTTSVSDNCVDVSDSYAGDLSGATTANPYPTCVGGTGDVGDTFTFTYSRTVPAPTLGTCQGYDNTASFADNSTPQNTGSSKKSVTVCNYNAPLTIGYWTNHLASSSKTSTWYDSYCSKPLNGTGCSSNGPWTKQFLPQLLGGYTVDTVLKAAQVFVANNCSNASSSAQNAVGCLAAQLLGAELNVANLSKPCIVTVADGINDANSFMKSGTVDGVTGVTYTGPMATYSLTTAQRNEAIVLKNKLVNYNQGGGC